MVSAVQCSEEGGSNTAVDSTDSPSNSSETVDKNKDQSDGLSFEFDALSYFSLLQQRSFIIAAKIFHPVTFLMVDEPIGLLMCPSNLYKTKNSYNALQIRFIVRSWTRRYRKT